MPDRCDECGAFTDDDLLLDGLGLCPDCVEDEARGVVVADA